MASILWFKKKRLYILFFYNEPACWYLCHSWTPMGTRKDEGSRAPGQENLVRSMQWCSCKGPRLQSAETLTACSTEMQTQPPVLPPPGSPSPRSSPCPKESHPLCLPFLGFAPEYHPHPDVAYLWQFTKLYPGSPLRWGLGTSHSFSKRLLFDLGGPRHSPGWVWRTPSISPQI